MTEKRSQETCDPYLTSGSCQEIKTHRGQNHQNPSARRGGAESDWTFPFWVNCSFKSLTNCKFHLRFKSSTKNISRSWLMKASVSLLFFFHVTTSCWWNFISSCRRHLRINSLSTNTKSTRTHTQKIWIVENSSLHRSPGWREKKSFQDKWASDNKRCGDGMTASHWTGGLKPVAYVGLTDRPVGLELWTYGRPEPSREQNSSPSFSPAPLAALTPFCAAAVSSSS